MLKGFVTKCVLLVFSLFSPVHRKQAVKPNVVRHENINKTNRAYAARACLCGSLFQIY